MSKLQNDEDDELMENVNALRKRLMETEKNLHRLQTPSKPGENRYRYTSGNSESLDDPLPPLTLEDLTPDSRNDYISRTKGYRSKPPGHLDSIGSVASFSLHKGTGTSKLGTRSSLPMKDFDNEALRIKLQAQREENAQLITQNHNLLSQLEDTGYQLHSTQEKLNLLNVELDSARESVPKLKHQVSSLKDELSTYDSALRSTEQRLNESHHYHAEKDKHFEQVKTELIHVKNQLEEETEKRKRFENQKEGAKKNLEELNEQLEKYRSKTQQKLQKYQSSEEHLRESLLHCDKEREELLDRATGLEEQLQDLSEEITRLREVEHVEKPALIAKNKDLQTSLSKQLQLVKELESSLESSVHDREELQELTSRQNQRLAECQREVEQSYQQLRQLEDLLQKLQTENERNSYTHGQTHQLPKPWTSSPTNSIKSIPETLLSSISADLDVYQGTNGSYKAQVEELKMKLAMKEAELQSLNSARQKEETRLNDSGVMDGLRSELMSIIEKSKQGDRKKQELESIIQKMVDDRARTKSEIFMLRDQLADSNARNTALKARITQRNAQVVELQNDVEERQSELAGIQRMLKKKSNQLELVERDLDEKSASLSQHVAKLESLQEELENKKQECRNFKNLLDEKNAEVDDVTQSIDKIKNLHAEQCHELEKQIEMFQNLCDERLQQVKASEQSMLLLRSELEVKESEVNDLSKKLLSNNKELSNRLADHQEAWETLNNRAYQDCNKVAQLESALTVCKQQFQKCVEQMEGQTDDHERAMEAKMKEIDTLQKLIRELQNELESKEAEVAGLHETLEERQQMLVQSSNRISYLEDQESQQEQQISHLEKQLSQVEASAEQDADAMEKKLHHACSDLEERTGQVAKLTKNTQQLEREVEDKGKHIEHLVDALQQVKKDSENQTQKKQDLETELNQANTNIQQYQQKIKDLEQEHESTQNDLQQYKNQTTEMDSELRQAQGQLHEAFEQLAYLQGTLHKSKSTAKSHEEKANKLGESLRQSHDELKVREKDIEQLDEALKSRQRQLQQRAAQLAQLNSAIKVHQGEMEERILVLQSELSRTQADLQHRNKQIENLDDTVNEQKSQMKDRALQIQQLEQNMNQVKKENTEKSSRITELEQKIKNLQNTSDDQKQDVREQAQQLRLTREQMQRQQIELADIRRQLADVEREKHRIERELEETIQLCQSKDSNNTRLAEEAGAAKARETSIQSKLSAELESLKKKQHEERTESELQLAQLQDSYSELLASKNQQEASHKVQVQQMQELESKWLEEIRLAEDQITHLQNELGARKEVIEAANEAIVIKEAEVARLSAKISGYERATFGIRLTPNHQMETPPTHQSSHLQVFGPDLSHSPRRLMKRSSSDFLLSNLGSESRFSGVSSLASPLRGNPRYDSRYLHSPHIQDEDARGFYQSPMMHMSSPKSHNIAGDLARSSQKQTRTMPKKYPELDSFQSMLDVVNQRIANEESKTHRLNGMEDQIKYGDTGSIPYAFRGSSDDQTILHNGNSINDEENMSEAYPYGAENIMPSNGDASPQRKQTQRGSKTSPPVIPLKEKLAKERALLAASQKSKATLPGPQDFMVNLQERLKNNESRRRKVDRQLFGMDEESERATDNGT
ncbi:coiled-coil domain-containing protein 18-like [Anneissia japonica]|uniref:coiled-coil domain-containing protein 18-like n=1 Tax=Anneissia japonica TaxID=1529436 RepID=UPI0014259F4D|nr:coiled-coil domain-containing protein 18-like [Anneissia japonica]XP_033105653.1 coiled-coil domain-containing protein 18-like [Anneissia japonica]XP_033105658.1 coiled-coil domain-containing protein 18-like [Anneissia japonica]